MRLSIIKPADDLAGLVAFYCLCDDEDGSHAGRDIITAPQLATCLCIQLGDPVLTDFRDSRPLMSVAGVQSKIRRYVPEGSVRALILFLTALGSIRLAPQEGSQLVDEGYDCGGLIGDGAILALRRAASAAPDQAAIGRVTDQWLRAQFARRPERADHARLASAAGLLKAGEMSIRQVADGIDLSERQLERAFLAHFGLSPKRYQQLGRVTRSLNATLSGQGDALDGFADQAHQIRAFKAHFGATPGQFRRRGPTPLGALYQRQSRPVAGDWAHYL